MGHGAVDAVADVFREQFGPQARALVIADPRTYQAAGGHVHQALSNAGLVWGKPYLLESPDLYAEFRFVEELDEALADASGAIPIAVGSGTINDLTKLAARRAGRLYMVVATAASMDGYTAYGASITYHGSKQTFNCPAPRAVVADLDVICGAPRGMNSSGYADLLAKLPAGADWILADSLGVEPIDSTAWRLVQAPLREWLREPAAIDRSEPGAIRRLVEGLMMGGFAMQSHQTSRPASGAEHQFSHLWDMQHHTHEGHAPSHGHKVGIGSIASLALYEQVLALPLDTIDVDDCCRRWKSWGETEAAIRKSLGEGELGDKAVEEMQAKYLDQEQLKAHLVRLREAWPAARERLQSHLISPRDSADMLAAAGAPSRPEQIGISPERLRTSFEQAYYIRRRFTVLDLAVRANVLEPSLDKMFSDPSSPLGNREERG